MSTVYFTSDIHIGHLSIAKMRCAAFNSDLYDARTEDNEFDEWEQDVTDWHDTWLAQIWDETLSSGDQLWVLGDISSGTKASQMGALEWVRERAENTGAELHLIAGNHDDAHPMHRDSYKWLPIYLGVFNTVQAYGRRRIPYYTGGHADAFLSHFPYHGDHGKERYVQYRLPDLGRDFVIHGHTHSAKRFVGRQLHVGVDAWAGQLVPVQTINDYVNGKLANRPSDRVVEAPETSGDTITPEALTKAVYGSLGR
ncbi:phosphoesterase [Mycobacterium phage EniyanLRS]|uniref:Phosphoesterase n=1 Tax=Mycobacterium phage EniyanLRS TaxID=1933770 RepID=A0A2I2MPK3_9CAUD|nr:phosphoesterase [Mycobacterium phage EniyanLRS]